MFTCVGSIRTPERYGARGFRRCGRSLRRSGRNGYAAGGGPSTRKKNVAAQGNTRWGRVVPAFIGRGLPRLLPVLRYPRRDDWICGAVADSDRRVDWLAFAGRDRQVKWKNSRNPV